MLWHHLKSSVLARVVKECCCASHHIPGCLTLPLGVNHAIKVPACFRMEQSWWAPACFISSMTTSDRWRMTVRPNATRRRDLKTRPPPITCHAANTFPSHLCSNSVSIPLCCLILLFVLHLLLPLHWIWTHFFNKWKINDKACLSGIWIPKKICQGKQ